MKWFLAALIVTTGIAVIASNWHATQKSNAEYAEVHRETYRADCWVAFSEQVGVAYRAGNETALKRLRDSCNIEVVL